MSYYTYTHTRNDTGVVFYVGKGSGERAYSTLGRNTHWSRITAKHGRTVHIEAMWNAEEDAMAHEKSLIVHFKNMNVPLANKTEGGEGCSGYKHTSQSLIKMSDWQIGKCKTNEHKAKISRSLTGRILSQSNRDAISKGQLGKTKTPETKLKISNSAKKTIKTKEHCFNLSKCKTGKAVVNDGSIEKRVTQEEMILLTSLGWSRGLLKSTCPHCRVMGGRSHMTRWHFENCKKRFA
jgi:hypothetical protein